MGLGWASAFQRRPAGCPTYFCMMTLSAGDLLSSHAIGCPVRAPSGFAVFRLCQRPGTRLFNSRSPLPAWPRLWRSSVSFADTFGTAWASIVQSVVHLFYGVRARRSSGKYSSSSSPFSWSSGSLEN